MGVFMAKIVRIKNLTETPITKCAICGIETKELFENVTEQGCKWCCKKCADVRYRTRWK